MMTPDQQRRLAALGQSAALLLSECRLPCLHILCGGGGMLCILSATSIPASAVQSCAQPSSPIMLPDGTMPQSTPLRPYSDPTSSCG